MQKNITREAAGYLARAKRRRIWMKVVSVLGCVVVFCTTYALILPAITMEKTGCGLTEHTHTADCYTQVTAVTRQEPVCSLESLNLHEHTENCFDENGESVCGYADFVIHEHDTSCYDEDGRLWCPLPEIKAHTHSEDCYSTPQPSEVHTHTDECYTIELGELICTSEESDGHQHGPECYETTSELICTLPEEPHQHTDKCYAQNKVLTCELSTEPVEDPAEASVESELELICDKEEIILHEHVATCFDENGNLICGKTQVLEHVHSDACFETVEEAVDTDTLTCGLEEHTHTEDCSPQRGADDHALTEANPTVVVKAVVWLTGEDAVFSNFGQVMALMSSVSPYAESSPGDIADHLTSAQIEINGEPYDGESALNPGEQFTVALQWQLNRENLTDTLTYTYQLPDQIHVKDVAETVLYDENNNRKGVYSIVDGVLTVTYDNVADLNTTSFKLNATWNQNEISQETTVGWNDKLITQVKFDNSQIAVTKELLGYETMEDGSLIAEYAVNVAASGAAENITLTDTLTSEKFHFCQGYYEVNGEKFDYRYKIVNADGSEEYQYANFPEGTFDKNGKQLKNIITFPNFDLVEGQTCTVEYAVKLDADERFELDKDQSAAGLTNSATASYPSGEDTIKSSVTVTDTYRADKKWILKEKGNLGAGDVDQDTEVPWKVTVNPIRDYDMGGAVISDSVRSEGVVYKTDKPITITSTTENGPITSTPAWITLSDATVSAIRSVGGNAADLLYLPENVNYRNEISTAVGHDVSKEELTNYVFVGESKNQFVWFSPKTGTPTTYELSYITDISKATSGSLVNSAEAGWKSWTAGVVNGSFLQEINIEKENDGIYKKEDDYFVNWTITLKVPAGCNAIPGMFLYDALPYHNESGGYDRLVGLNASEVDFARLQGSQEEKLTYLNGIAQPAFKIRTTSGDADVQTIVNNAAATLGYPGAGLTEQDYKLYEENDTLRGQFPIVNGGDTYNGLRMTPTHFGVWLGDLPATTGKDGYTITVQYTTQVDPKLVEGLNGRAYGYNAVGLFQRQENTDAFLGEADSSYWLDHANVQNALDKSVAAFDSEHNIVTYQVNINPDASLEASGYADYILRDVLNLPGASFIESSFQLSFQGTVTEASAFVWDSSKKTVLWRSDDGQVDLSYDLSDGMKQLTSFNVENPADGSSQFTLTLTNSNNVLALTGPEEFKGRLAPMVLTYQVQLPAGAEKPEQETIKNSVTVSVKPADGSEVIIDGVQTEFDYTSALHKWLNTVPNGNNGYTAAFIINVDKTTEEWKNVGNTFTVSDEMSKSLVVDVNSIKVYGIKKDNTEELLSDQYTSSYDDRANELKNFLSITITDSDEYTRYRIEYNASVQGEAEHTVVYDNVASVEGTDISSEKVIKEVYIQKQEANVDETNYEVKLLKFDAGNTAVRLKAKFTLYAWEDGKWTEKLTNLTTDDKGELVLNNTLYQGLNLGPDTWYKLEETEAPAGYLKGVTYFHIGQADESKKPEGIGSYTTIPLKGGTHQIPNYKASIRLHKMDEEKGSSSYLTGAEFALYGSSDCSGEPLAVAKEDRKGIYSFELTGLTAGQEYFLKEIKAPDGYRLSDTVYTLSFDQEGNVTLKNGNAFAQTDSGGAYLIANISNYELPQTGGSGTTLYTIGGLLTICAGLLLLYRNKKRRKEDFASS